MDDKEIINLDDINYAIYKIGDWSKHYEINQIGLSQEIPVTKNTVFHVKFSMEEIRNTKFDMEGKSINGFVLFALQLNPNVQKMDLDDVITLEEEEYQNILKEIDDLELLDDKDTIPLENDKYLIYKLEKECHVTTSIPANEFAKEFYKRELKKIENALD